MKYVYESLQDLKPVTRAQEKTRLYKNARINKTRNFVDMDLYNIHENDVNLCST